MFVLINYTGKAVGRNDNGVCSSRSGNYELAGSYPSPSSHNSVVVEFDNILYTERPTAAKEDECYKLVS